MKSFVQDVVPGLVGALLGGAVGYYLFAWIVKQGYDAPVLVGAFAGLGCGIASRTDSNRRGLACGLLALVGGILAQWKHFTFAFTQDGSLREFLLHLHQVPPITLGLIAVGGFLGFWWGREWTLRPRLPRPIERP
ncbi:hypothetical protein TA3x_005198 [Tundrisphaera sp. TA3]|uniref:hypothetical protein n=1 Tax=Tundrisphaera sp. TA3 TaxID=3435775 RepID=UPI003EBF65E0